MLSPARTARARARRVGPGPAAGTGAPPGEPETAGVGPSGVALGCYVLAMLSALFFQDVATIWMANALLIVAAAFAQLLHHRTPFQVVLFWQLGFLYILAREGMWANLETGRYAYLELHHYLGASRFLCLANGALLIVWELACNWRYRGLTPSAGGAWLRDRVLRLDSPMLVIVAAGLAALYFINFFPAALAGMTSGRRGFQEVGGLISAGGALGPILRGFFAGIQAAIPAALLYGLRSRGLPGIAIAIACAVPIWTILFMQGTRFPLLFSMLAVVILLFGGTRRFTVQQLIALMVAAFILLSTATTMRAVRSDGVQDVSLNALTGEVVSQFDRRFEGVLFMVADLVRHFDHPGNVHHLGSSSTFVLYFWVPRAVWPEKPTMLGYWFLREASADERGHSEGHSVSFSFAGDAYVDFGPIGGVVFCAFFGLIWGRIDRWVRRWLRQPEDFRAVLAVTFFAAAFFSVRSPMTSFFQSIGVILVLMVLFLGTRVLHAEGAPSRPRRLRRVSSAPLRHGRTGRVPHGPRTTARARPTSGGSPGAP